MKIKKPALLILAALSLHSEEFIDTSKELHTFSSQYDFGTPIKIKKKSEIQEDNVRVNEKNESTDESNISTQSTEIMEESLTQKLKKELGLKCGGKCGIDFKSTPLK